MAAVVMVHLLTFEQAEEINKKPIPGTPWKFSPKWDADLNLVISTDQVAMVPPPPAPGEPTPDPYYGWLHECPLIPWKRVQPGSKAAHLAPLGSEPSAEK